LKVTRKAPKPARLRVANAVQDTLCKKTWDKTKTPAQNLASMGLDPSPNAVKREHFVDPTKKGFVGMIDLPENNESDPYGVANPKRRQMSQYDQEYITRCVAKHGTDYDKMVMDIKTNFQQLTAQKLKKMHEKYLSLPEAEKLA
jgi:hypothetical protein